MQKKISGLLLACIILIGCSDRSYKGYTDLGGEEEYPDEPVPVMMAVGDPSYSVLTRGVGAFEPIDKDSTTWKKAVFYIYSFNKEQSADFSVTWDSDMNNDKDICLIDGSLDAQGIKGGKPARLNKGDYSFLEWVNLPDNIYYNVIHPDLPYNFYAYYIDDMDVPDRSVRREANRIFFDVKIDGSQDLMTSVAELTPTQEDMIESKYFGEQKIKLRNSLYSAYAANRGINPMFTFRHHLTRFKFRIYPGKPEADSVYVDSVCIYSRTKGVFTVVNKDISKMGIDFSDNPDTEPLYLKERGGTDLNQSYYRVVYNPDKEDENEYAKKDVYDRASLPVGESLLVAPADSYRVVVHLQQVFGNGKPSKYYLSEYTLTSARKDNIESKGFSAGQEYLVRIAVFGAQEIKVQVVTVEKWGEGGYVDINPDDIFEY